MILRTLLHSARTRRGLLSRLLLTRWSADAVYWATPAMTQFVLRTGFSRDGPVAAADQGFRFIRAVVVAGHPFEPVLAGTPAPPLGFLGEDFS